jgi:hypothetical protein
MFALHRLEASLPGRTTLDVALTFHPGFQPKFEEMSRTAEGRPGSRIDLGFS